MLVEDAMDRQIERKVSRGQSGYRLSGPIVIYLNGMGDGEWGMGNGEWGMGNGEWGMGNGEWDSFQVQYGAQSQI